MALQDPSWRIKTRPCPFFQQGRCLFADSCNFLHTVDITNNATQNARSEPPETPQNALRVIVDSPQSMRSPPRSPRMASLLFALRDVIGDPDDDDVTGSSMQTTGWSESLPTLVNKESFGFFPEPNSAPPAEEEYEDDDLESSGHWTAISDYDDEYTLEGLAEGEETGVEEEDQDVLAGIVDAAPATHRQSVVSSSSSGLLSPMELSTLNLGPFRNFSFREDSNSSFDSGYGDAWKPPVPLMSSPPRSPSIASTFDLLASPFGAASHRLSASPHRSPLLGGGAGIAARSPSSPTLTAIGPEAGVEPPDLGIDSPTEYHRQRVIEELTAQFARANRAQAQGAEDETDAAAESYGHTSVWDADAGDTAVFVGGNQSQAPLDEEVQDELRRLSRTPTHFLAEEPDFQDQEPAADSSSSPAPAAAVYSGMDNDDAGNAKSEKSSWSDDDTTAFLAYLASPTVQPAAAPENNDTINSLYDVYSAGVANPEDSATPASSSSSSAPAPALAPVHIPSGSPSRPPTDPSPVSPSPSTTTTTSSSLRERVFTPPPVASSSSSSFARRASASASTPSRKRSGTVTADSPNSVSSPITSLDSVSRGRASPFGDQAQSSSSAQGHGQGRGEGQGQGPGHGYAYGLGATGRQSPFAVQEVEVVSKKVPFGFRSSFALGPSSKSSLMTNRRDSKSIPPSPLQNQADVSPPPLPPLPTRASPTSETRSHSRSRSPPPASRDIPKGLKPLRLSTIFNSRSSSSLPSPSSSHSANGFQLSGISKRSSISAASVSSSNSFTNNPLISSSRTHMTTPPTVHGLTGPPASSSEPHAHAFSPRSLHHHLFKSISNTSHRYTHSSAGSNGPRSAPVAAWRASVAINYSRPSSRLSEPVVHEAHDEDDFGFDDDLNNLNLNDDDDDDTGTGTFSRRLYDEAIRRPVSTTPYSAPHSAPAASHAAPQHPPRASTALAVPLRPPATYIETPKPTLLFAIASDDAEQVRRVLAAGGRDADPNNDMAGPQSALEFALTSEGLVNKLEIVKALLAYGADPAGVVKKGMDGEKQLGGGEAGGVEQGSGAGGDEDKSGERAPSRAAAAKPLMDAVDPATRYYIERADAMHTKRMSVLINRSFFRPLTRVRYDLIGQDRALEQLFRVLSIHSRDLAVSPMVVMLCGPSGHGKSLLARKFGSLLEVPTHTVNMTTLRSTLDLWNSHSMSPYETPTTCTLAEFIINNEGKRCVVVLDEIEKTEDPKTLWSLLMPWELGRCAFESGKRHVDVKNVIWLGTSNIGHDLVFQHHTQRKCPEDLMSREEYVELMSLLRPKVSERLGASILSRITTVLPFVPFTMEEKRAICSEALYNLGGEVARSMSPEEVGLAIEAGLASYIANEGARSLHRAVSNYLVDVI